MQPGRDAARTASTDAAGPEWNDVAWMLQFNGSAAGISTVEAMVSFALYTAEPVLIGSDAYVVLRDRDLVGAAGMGYTGPPLTERAVYRVELATGAATLVAPLDMNVTGYASDGERLYLAGQERLDVVDLQGALAWTAPHPVAIPGGVVRDICTEPAVTERLVVLACAQRAEPREVATPRSVVAPTAATVHVFAYDRVDGVLAWHWVNENDCATEPQPIVPVGACAPAAVPTAPPIRLVVSGLNAYVLTVPAGLIQTQHLTAISAENGELAWEKPLNFATVSDLDPSEVEPSAPGDVSKATILAAPDRVYHIWRDVRAYDAATGELVYRQPLTTTAARANDAALGALRDGALYVASEKRLLRIDTSDQTIRWDTRIAGEDWVGNMGVTPLALYVTAFTADDAGFAFYSVDLVDGTQRWRHPVSSHGNGELNFWSFGLSQGLLVSASNDGQMLALGMTNASMRVAAEIGGDYPRLGETVRVDLGGTQAGALGSPVAYRARWGDGSESEWQDSPVLEHAYTVAGEHVARFQARAENGHTASMTHGFHVGARPPNAIEKAFAAENQDGTFFVIGLVLTALGALFGLLRYRRRHLVLGRELRALDEAYARTRADPMACEKALAALRTRYHDMLVRGKLDDGVYGILTRRAEEHAREARLGLLHDRLAFLPHGLGERLRRQLDDGHISAWERDHFLQALAAEPTVTPEQRDRATRLIEEWCRRDASAPGT